MAAYTVTTPDGPVYLHAASHQVDDSGHLGFFDDSGFMFRNWFAGAWSDVTEGWPEVKPVETPPSEQQFDAAMSVLAGPEPPEAA